jgi:hypothetical protein
MAIILIVAGEAIILNYVHVVKSEIDNYVPLLTNKPVTSFYRGG